MDAKVLSQCFYPVEKLSIKTLQKFHILLL